MSDFDQPYDAIIVPSGGLAETGELHEWTRRRLNQALCYKNSQYFLTLSAGTHHKPLPRDKEGFCIFESVAAAQYLQTQGINEEKLLFETASYDTIGNAYFARVIHVEPRKLRTLKIITSEFHMARTQAIFEFIFSRRFMPFTCELSFETVSDDGLDVEQRVMRERQSLDAFLERSARVNDEQQLHQWLFSEHAAYSVSKRREVLDKKVLDTY